MARFVEGHAVSGDVHAFSKAMLRYNQGDRMSAYELSRQVQAWTYWCDDITASFSKSQAWRASPLLGGGKALQQ